MAVYEVGYDRWTLPIWSACAQDTMAGVVAAHDGFPVSCTRVIGRHAHVPDWGKP